MVKQSSKSNNANQNRKAASAKKRPSKSAGEKRRVENASARKGKAARRVGVRQVQETASHSHAAGRGTIRRPIHGNKPARSTDERQVREAGKHAHAAGRGTIRRPIHGNKPASQAGGRQVREGGNHLQAAGRGASRCPVARECGACQHVDVPYADQLAAKDARIAELFADFPQADIRPILGMSDPFHYRNKVTSPFAPGKRGPNGGREILTGMYAAGTHRLVPTDGCLLENEQAQQAIVAIRTIMRKYGIAPYDENRGTGFLRHVIVRVGHESGEVLVTLVTNDEAFPNSKAFCRELMRRCPFITTIVQNVNTRQTNVILGQREQRLYGPGFILDTLCGLSFRISSQSFYQVNAEQTTVLYDAAIDLAQLDGAQRAIDAYCGTGTIGLVAAKRGAAEVIGVDSVESAIRDARENARHNGVENAQFVAADATEFMREFSEAGERADVVLMDPPRAGSTPEFLDAAAQLAPARIVYVSCNPATQVRDVRHLAQRGYQLQVVQPVDMFPHTDHVECVALLSKS